MSSEIKAATNGEILESDLPLDGKTILYIFDFKRTLLCLLHPLNLRINIDCSLVVV
jgi:hypothetical protein